jgi:adenosine deaminase
MHDGLCIDQNTLTVSKETQCQSENQLNHIAENPELYNRLIDAWSMQNITATENGHDHFFNTFLKFIPISNTHRSQTLTEAVNRAGEQNEMYLETMITNPVEPGIALAQKTTWHTDLATMFNELKIGGLENTAKKITQDLAVEQTQLKENLHCNTAKPAPGCPILQNLRQAAK